MQFSHYNAKNAHNGAPSEKNIISAFGSMKPYPLENLPFVNSVVIEKLSINIKLTI